MYKFICFSLLLFSCFIPINGNEPTSNTQRFKPQENTEKTSYPQNPANIAIYCTLVSDILTVYSHEPLQGEIEIIDNATGEQLCHGIADLGAGFTTYLQSTTSVTIYVTVDDQTYYCII